jgi:ADP-ribosylglycohydrolase
LAPVPLAFGRRPVEEAIERAAESSRTTHQAPEVVDACRCLAALILGALGGVAKRDLLAGLYEPVPGLWQRAPLAPRIEQIATGSFHRKAPPEIRGSGYVVASLEAALWALDRSESFDDGVLLAVNLGDDADTTGAVYGQVARALYGKLGIREPWRAQLVHHANDHAPGGGPIRPRRVLVAVTPGARKRVDMDSPTRHRFVVEVRRGSVPGLVGNAGATFRLVSMFTTR